MEKEQIKSVKFEFKKVMIVDDDELSRNVGQIILEKIGLTVIIAEDGQIALDKYEKEVPDLILMDVNMPNLDGFSATSIIRKKEENTHVHTPIIAITAYAMCGDSDKCISAGMDDYISKPILIEDLIAKVKFWLNKANK